jgi:hypothetical protein
LGLQHPIASQMTFLQIVVFVWLLSNNVKLLVSIGGGSASGDKKLKSR